MDYKKLAAILLTVLIGAGSISFFVFLQLVRYASENSEATIVSENEIRFEDVMEGQIKDIPVTDDTKYAYLQLSSTYKDIRAKLLDEDGNRIKGRKWQITVADSKEKSEEKSEETAEGFLFEGIDEDGDGIIHIDSLDEGKYYVSLKSPSGYESAPGSVPISIKSQISYTVLSDILDIVKTEEEISPENDDTAYDEETDEGQIVYGSVTGLLGIDVSKYNKDIDWHAVRDFGVNYAIIRCGYRGSTSGYLVIDPYFYQNLYGAKEAGVETGVYFFTQAVTEAEAIEEASMVCALLRGEDIDYPVFLDVESSGGRADGLPAMSRTLIINAFVNTMQQNGYRAGVYANKNWFTNKIMTGLLPENTVIWLAQYNVKGPDYQGEYDMWQFTSRGHIPGIEGYVDMDVLNSRNDYADGE